MITGGGMIVLEGAAPFMATEWKKLAEAHGMRMVPCYPKSYEEFIAIAKESKAKVIVNSYEVARNMGSYSSELIHQLADIGVVAVCHEGAGYDVVGDVHVWKEYGVQVSNCPNSVALDTANTAIYLTLSAMRNFFPMVTSLRAGTWRSNIAPGISTSGRTLGILGMGNIGRMYRDRARTLGFEKIQYHGRTKLAPEFEQDSVYVPNLDEFLASTDVIVLVLPLNKHTRHLINKERLAKCKDGVVIVNIARGPIVDEAALSEALDSGKVRSVGLDVYEHEPEIYPGLLANPKITLLPHAGPLTDMTRINLERELFANVESFLDTGSVINLVPELKD